MPGVMSLTEFTGSMAKTHDRYNTLIYHENAIRRDMAKVQECFLYIGYRLLDIQDSKLYDCIYHQGSGDYCKNIYQYAAQELDICKSTTYQLMTVATVFSERDMRTGLKPQYKDYSFSQLVELSSVPAEFHKYCDPHMPIKKIREWKAGKNVNLAFGGAGSSEGESSTFGLCRDFQIPPELFAKFQTSGTDTGTESTIADVLPGQISIDDSFQTSGMETKTIDVADNNVPADNLHNSSITETWLLLTKAYNKHPSEELRCAMNNLTTASGRPVRDSSLGRSMPAAEWYRNEYERTVNGVVGNICAWFNIDYDSAFELFFNALIDGDIIQAIKLHCERSLNSSFK